MLLALIMYYCCHYGSWFHCETMWVSGGSPGPIVMCSYWSLSYGDLTGTSSHICGSWYLPIFLFRDGSLTLINTASLMALAIFWSSLPTMLKLSRDSSWPVVLWWSCMGDGALMCSLNLSAKVLPDFPNVLFITIHPSTLVPVNHSTLLQYCVIVFWGIPGGLWWYCLL